MKLLIVEDEVKTGEYLKQGLNEAGFIVDLSHNGLDGHHLAMTEPYDLLILDVMLPDVDGWRILQSLRDAGKEVPVLFLTLSGQALCLRRTAGPCPHPAAPQCKPCHRT